MSAPLEEAPEDRKRKLALEVLELGPEASLFEVRNAYNHLKELYSAEAGSIALNPILDEISDEDRQALLAEIEEAYAWLSTHADGRAGAQSPSALVRMNDEVREAIAGIERFDGAALKRVREHLGISLHEIELVTKIGLQHIRNLEEGNYASLPEGVYIRGYLGALSRCLGLDQRRVAEEYMAALEDWKAARQK